MRKLLILALGILAACAAFGSSDQAVQEPTFLGLWMRLDSTWKPSPPEIGYEEETARARLLRLHQDGQVSLLACLLRRNKLDTSLSPADGYAVYRGSWHQENGRVIVRYVKTEEMIPSSAPPFSEFLESFLTVNGTSISLGKIVFKRSEILSLAQYDDFVKRVPSVSRQDRREKPPTAP
jgi:hypothetical protein